MLKPLRSGYSLSFSWKESPMAVVSILAPNGEQTILLTAQVKTPQHSQERVSEDRRPRLGEEHVDNWIGLMLIVLPWILLLLLRDF
jgi:hypothetical protein